MRTQFNADNAPIREREETDVEDARCPQHTPKPPHSQCDDYEQRICPSGAWISTISKRIKPNIPEASCTTVFVAVPSKLLQVIFPIKGSVGQVHVAVTHQDVLV